MKVEKGQRVNFLWENNSITPGTITDVTNKKHTLLVTVNWDDGTQTKTSKSFLESHTVEGKFKAMNNKSKNIH